MTAIMTAMEDAPETRQFNHDAIERQRAHKNEGWLYHIAKRLKDTGICDKYFEGNFDDFIHAALVCFQCLTADGWTALMNEVRQDPCRCWRTLAGALPVQLGVQISWDLAYV